MAKPYCFIGKCGHYTGLRLQDKRRVLRKALQDDCGSTNTDLPSDNVMLLFLTYEDDIRGMRIHQLQNRLHKQKAKIERLKKKLTEANDIIRTKKFENIRVCPACNGLGMRTETRIEGSSGTSTSKRCFSCSGRGLIKVD